MYNSQMVETKATQEFVPIKEVRDGIITLKDGSLRAIMMVSSINFSLKSPDEQEAIIFQFQNFLNSLDFSIQIAIQSRALDIRPYIASLETRYKNELGDLMKIQIREYINFVKNFVDQSSIMTKTFFVVIPFSPTIINTKNGFFGKKEQKSDSQNKLTSFEENRTQLEQRVGNISQGLVRCGIRSVQLGTEEVVELLYKTFNPGDLEKPIIN
jgi:type IV secretory pathway VirB4 component